MPCIAVFVSKLWCIWLQCLWQGQEFLSVLFIVSPVPGRKIGQNRSLRNICRLHELNPWLLCLAGHPLSVLYMTEWCLYLSGFAWAKMCHTGFRKRLMDPSGSLGFSGAQFEKNPSCPSLRVSSCSCMHIITFLSFFFFPVPMGLIHLCENLKQTW